MEKNAMDKLKGTQKHRTWLVFGFVFFVCVILGATLAVIQPVTAAPADPDPRFRVCWLWSCNQCHENIHDAWITTPRAGISAPIFV
jgi:hypothetical protein